MAQSPILQRDGQPYETGELTEELAAPTLTGVRSVWTQGVAAGMTPARLASILQAAADGNAHDYLTLAEEIEERDAHYAAVLGTRKRAVAGLPVHVEAAGEDAQSVKLADAVRDLVKRPAFGYLVDDTLDALGKGYSVCEIVWDRSGKTWEPVAYPHRDPRFFAFTDASGLAKLGLLDDSQPGQPLAMPAYKFVTHVPRIKAGIPLRGGLARLIAFGWMCKAYTQKDWIAFAEVYGMPLRLGRYGPGASERDVAILRQAVANIGSDAAAVLPRSMEIDFEQVASGGTGSTDVFERLADWVDRQTSKGVLGQTMTTDAQSAGMGSNQAGVHNEVRDDITKADAKQLSDTLNRDLVRAYIDLNYGPQAQYPRVELQVVEPEDLTGLTAALKDLVPLGLRVSESEIRGKFGLSEPGDDDTLTAPTAAAGGGFQGALNRRSNAGQNGLASARNRADNAESAADAIDELTDELAGDDDWQEQLEPLIDPIEQLAGQVDSADEFRQRLPELLEQMDASQLIEKLSDATFRSRGLGDSSDQS
ncbi:DUF935 domain-containing protein [Salinisphaera orenii]|uniref:DUF935 domain-containing protein n=1 Tax=Salinisphaera orenii TaxID=856731 RepID=UPI000DBE395E